MKKFLILFLLLTPLFSFAALPQDPIQGIIPPPDSSLGQPLDTNYEKSDFVQLVPLGQLGTGDSNTSLAQYVNNLFVLVISLAAMLAVLRIIVGGFEYMTQTMNPKATSKARETIQNAAIGLILLLSTYLIFSTINPGIVDLNALRFTDLAPSEETLKKIRDNNELMRQYAAEAAKRAGEIENFGKGKESEMVSGTEKLSPSVQKRLLSSCKDNGGAPVTFIYKDCTLEDGSVEQRIATEGGLNPYIEAGYGLRTLGRIGETAGNIAANKCPISTVSVQKREAIACLRK